MDQPINTDAGCYTEHGVSGYGVAIKLTCDPPLDESAAKSMAERMMMSIAVKCIDLGAKCIGHIKSHVRTEAGTFKADTIGVGHGAFSVGNLEHPVSDLYMAINSIVQGIPEDKVKQATLDGIHETASILGISVEKEREHTYFDEFDFTANKEEYRRKLEEQLIADESE